MIQNLKNLSKVRSLKDLKNHVINVQKGDAKLVHNLIYNRSDYGPNASNILDKYGNQKIISIRIFRTPLSNTLMNLFDLVTLKQFSERVKKEDYEKLFHLGLHVR